MLKNFHVRAAVTSIVLVLALVLSFTYYNQEEIVLRRLVGHTGARDLEYNVTGWARVEEGMGWNDPGALAAAAAQKLGLPAGSAGLERWENSFARGAQVTGGLRDGARATVTAQAMSTPGGAQDTHLMVSISGSRKFAARIQRDSARSVLAAFGKEARTGITVDGRLSWGNNQTPPDTPAHTSLRLPLIKPVTGAPSRAAGDPPDLLATAGGMMAMAGANVQERTQKDNLVSLAGYTKKLARIFRYENRAININVACRHDPVEGVTYIYAATPLILIEY
ncbi:MAG: YwmB family TATA-box binding protein [Firmicutes bacterium]|nr:YwmB family TATA-box binding protein [Bacillota bacterium]